MLSLYYRIWMDAIVYTKSKKDKDGAGWQAPLMIIISVLGGLNLLVLLFILHWLTGGKMPVMLPVSIFTVYAYNSFVSIVCTFFLPFLIINYLLIFYENRYQKLIKTYGDKGGKLYRNYFIASAGLVVIPIVIKFVLL